MGHMPQSGVGGECEYYEAGGGNRIYLHVYYTFQNLIDYYAVLGVGASKSLWCMVQKKKRVGKHWYKPSMLCVVQYMIKIRKPGFLPLRYTDDMVLVVHFIDLWHKREGDVISIKLGCLFLPHNQIIPAQC